MAMVLTGFVLAVSACVYTELVSYWTRQDDRYHTTTLERVIPYFIHWVTALFLLLLPQHPDFATLSIAHPTCYTASILFFTVIMGFVTFIDTKEDAARRVPHPRANDSYLFYILVMVNYPIFLCGYCLTMQESLTVTVTVVVFGFTIIYAAGAMGLRAWYIHTRKKVQS